jgi:hypothetical protein
VSREPGVPAAEPALKALSLGERRRAARELGAALYARPELAGEAGLWREPALMELPRELFAQVSPVDPAAFQAQAQAQGRAAWTPGTDKKRAPRMGDPLARALALKPRAPTSGADGARAAAPR